MKKIILSLILTISVTTAFANLNGNGYYRVKNYGTQRWASLVDNKATVDKIAGDAELHALQLSKDTENILSDPASIVYVTKISGNQYDLAAQGTSLESLVDNPVYIEDKGTIDGESYYRIYGKYKGVVKYISDGNLVLSQNYGDATLNDIGVANVKNWMFYPVDVNSEYYFGAIPTVDVNNDLYCSLFTSFAYQPYSTGVKAYYIGRIGFGMAEMIEIDGAVPPGSPVVIQCAGQNVADNKLKIIESTQNVLPSNALKGVYFNYSQNGITNHVAYDYKTMRVLGKTSDGSLGFITVYNISYIPANTAYLKVPEGSATEIKCVSPQEFDANVPDAPELIYLDQNNVLYPQDDYVYSGAFNYPNSVNLKFKFFTDSSLSEDSAIGAYSPNKKDITIDPIPYGSYPFAYESKYSWVLPSWKGGNIYITINLQYQYVSFANSAGVEVIAKNENDLMYIGSSVYSEEGSEITIYNLSGQTMGSSKSGSFDMSVLPKGIYIAVSNGKTLKIMR